MIRFAKINDVPSIMKFIDTYWKKDHILARDISVFNYLYVVEERVNMVISIENEAINGILGFVPYDKCNKQLSLALWKSLKSKDGMIGLQMYDYLVNELNPNNIAIPGINMDTTKQIYNFLGFTCGKMNRFYRLRNMSDYKIALINEVNIRKANSGDISFTKINSIEEYEEIGICFNENSFNKDIYYVNNKYFNNPKYRYSLYLVEDNCKKLIIVLRKQECNGSACLRLIDMLGDYSLLECTTNMLDELLMKENCEYVDCYCCGVEKALFINAGFEDIEDSDNIIPEYFYPFERRNIDIFYAAKNDKQIMFKGDGDMDRPN